MAKLYMCEEMNTPIVTIITPTYNRSQKLKELYKSLCNQKNKAFIWLIVDDGSIDDTKEIVLQWVDEAEIKIKYMYKENGGKHTALNLGISQIDSPLTFIVDSDDALTEDAIDIVCNDYKNADKNKLCGIAYLRQSKKGNYLTNKMVPRDGLRENFCDCRYGRNIIGDMAEIWVTKCLKEYPFPEFPGEKFVSEDVVWIEMSKKYDMIFFNKAIYISDYLDEGLTLNRRLHNAKSPKGCMYRGEIQLESDLPFKYQVRAMMYYIIYGRFSGLNYHKLFKKSNHKLLFAMFLVPGHCTYKKWRKEI